MNDGANLYLYDAEGHVCAVQSSPVPGITVLEAYIYDAEGRRVEKGQITTFSCNLATNGCKAEHAYALGQSGEQITEVDGSGNWLHTNVYAAGQLFASYDQNGNSLNFQLTDWLGTRRVQTNYAGVPEAGFQSLPFGSRFASIPATNCAPDQDCYPADMTGTPLHFTGKPRDTESGLDYFGARYYSSTSGRFISPDWSTKEEPVPYAKLGDPQTLNLYAYVGNNPLTSVDISGHRSLAAGSPQGCAGEGSVGCSPAQQEALESAPNTKAQQQGKGEAFDAGKSIGGLFGTVKKLFDRGQQARSLADDVEEVQSWQDILGTANTSIKRDTSNNPGPQGDINVDIGLRNLAQAKLNYFGAKEAVDGAGLLSDFGPSVNFAKGMLPSLQQSVTYAQEQYDHAISAWAANLEYQATSVTIQ